MSRMFHKVEIELSSKCNAACPGCLRTILDSKKIQYEKRDLDIKTFQRRFEHIPISETQVKLCGVLGDPIMHPEILNFVKWLLKKGAFVEISTNGGLGKQELWRQLGKLSLSTQRLRVMFSVDGLDQTNAIYRKRTKFETIWRNMEIYAKTGGAACWVFINFDHNNQEKEVVREKAKELGFDFLIRRAVRNSFPNLNKVEKLKQVTAVSSEAKHEYASKATAMMNNDISLLDSNSVFCKYHHQNEIFVSSLGEVWPCCFLWDEFNQPNSNFQEKLNLKTLEVGWNSLHVKSLAEVLDGPLFREIESFWSSKEDFFIKRCFKSCGEKGNLQNTFSVN